MANYNTLGHNLKRKIFGFCEKLSKGFSKPFRKFVADMVFGLIAAQSSYLTGIARELKEDIALDKTVERLSRNLMNFDNGEVLMEQYFETVKKNFDDKTILIIDDSDISKPCSSKLEGLCRVRDGSTGELADGYWIAGANALTAANKQPIPIYSRVYSSLEEGYTSNNAETLKVLTFLSAHFPKETPRTFDRGYDAGYVFDYLIPNEEAFVVRMNNTRNLIHKGKSVPIKGLAQNFKGKFSLKFETKKGKKANCKISVVPVSLPKYPDKPLSLVICKGLGKEPLMLLTSLDTNDPRLGVTITKVYLMRWRIEEYYKFKKQGFGFEKFLVRSLNSIRNLDLLLTVAIGFIGTLSEKINESIEVMEIIAASKRLYGLAKFTFYAISDGLAAIFAKPYSGIRTFFKKPERTLQLSFWGCA